MELIDTASGRVALWAAGVAGALYLIGKIWKTFKRVEAVLRIVKWIEAEMKPNGGKSFRDEFNDLRGQFAAHLAEHAKPPVQINVTQGQPTGLTADAASVPATRP